MSHTTTLLTAKTFNGFMVMARTEFLPIRSRRPTMARVLVKVEVYDGGYETDLVTQIKTEP